MSGIDVLKVMNRSISLLRSCFSCSCLGLGNAIVTRLRKVSGKCFMFNIQTGIHKIFSPCNLIKMPRLNFENRNRIVALLDIRLSQNDVGNQFNVSRSTIIRLVRRYRETGGVQNRPRSGAPRVTTHRQDVYIHQRHLRNPFKRLRLLRPTLLGDMDGILIV